MSTPRNVSAHSAGGRYRQAIDVGPHSFVADEPHDRGGEDAGPSCFELLAAGLAASTLTSIKQRAERDEIVLRRVHVEVITSFAGARLILRKELRFEGQLEEKQRERLLEASKQCPLHQSLMGAITLETRLLS